MTEFSRVGRERLPARRRSTTVTIEWDARPLNLSLGYADDGRPLEVFARDAKHVNSAIDQIVDDGAVLVSLLLQAGSNLKAIAASLGRLPDGSPSSILGAIVDSALAVESAPA